MDNIYFLRAMAHLVKSGELNLVNDQHSESFHYYIDVVELRLLALEADNEALRGELEMLKRSYVQREFDFLND